MRQTQALVKEIQLMKNKGTVREEEKRGTVMENWKLRVHIEKSKFYQLRCSVHSQLKDRIEESLNLCQTK